MAGKRKDRTACYYWYSLSKNQRISWFFPSRLKATRWRDWECRFFVNFGTIEDAAKAWKDIDPTNIRKHWKVHKFRYSDWELRRAVILYDTKIIREKLRTKHMEENADRAPKKKRKRRKKK